MFLFLLSFFRSITILVQLNLRTYKEGGGGWIPILLQVFLTFFCQTSARDIFSSCSFIPRAHFDLRSVVVSYWELDWMHSTGVGAVIKKLKAHFARHGSPCQLVSDNGRQFIAAEFQEFTRAWDTKHTPTSPYTSKANGNSSTGALEQSPYARLFHRISLSIAFCI